MVIDQIRSVHESATAGKIHGVLIDTFTASVVTQIYDALSDANKTKLSTILERNITKGIEMCYKLTNL